MADYREQADPRREEALRARRARTARERQARERKLRRGARRWRIFLVVYTLLFLTAGALGCFALYRYAGAYEVSLPEKVMDELMASTTPEEWAGYVRRGAELNVSGFEDGEALFQAYYDTAVRDRPLTYWKDLENYTADSPVYKVRGGGVDLCRVTLTPVGHNAAGFGRERWQVAEIASIFRLDGLESVAVEIDAPADAEVYINGVAVGGDYRIGEVPLGDMTELESRFTQPPTCVRYRVDAMYGDITVTDAQGRVLTPALEEEGLLRYSLGEKGAYALTVRAPENVAVTVGGAALTAADAAKAEDGILAGLEAYTGGAGVRTLTYSFEGLHAPPEVAAYGPGGESLTPLVNEKGEFIFFAPQDEALAGEVSGRVREFFDRYTNYASQAYDAGRQQLLLDCILPDTELYSYVRDSRDAMIWASATQVTYDELTFADFVPAGENCFTCTIRYKADFAAVSWYERYTYDLQSAYELAFVRSGGAWVAAAMSTVSG